MNLFRPGRRPKSIDKIRNIQQDLLSPDRVRVALSHADGPSQVEKIKDLLRVRLSELKSS